MSPFVQQMTSGYYKDTKTYRSSLVIAAAVATAISLLSSTPIIFAQTSTNNVDNSSMATTATTPSSQNSSSSSMGNNNTGSMTTMESSSSIISNNTSSSMLSLAQRPFLIQHIPSSTNETSSNSTTQTFSGNGTLMLPNSTIPIKMKFNGTVTFSPLSLSGKEFIRTEDGKENATATFYEVSRFNPQTMTGKGVNIVIIRTNSTGQFASLDGMTGVGIDRINADGSSDQMIWEWQVRIPFIKDFATG